MKRLVLLIILVLSFGFTFKVNTHASEKVKVYMFSLDGCPHCIKETEYLLQLEGYNKKFELIDLEVTTSDFNYRLSEKVSEYFIKEGFTDAVLEGFPYIVIGDVYAKAGYNEDLEDYINKVYQKGDKDIVGNIKNNLLVEDSELQSSKNTNVNNCRCNKTKKTYKNLFIGSTVAITIITLALSIIIIKKK